MTHWEYLILRLDTTSVGILMPHYINNQPIPEWEASNLSLHEALNQLGDEGWELSLSYPSLKSLLFKRPKIR